MDLITVLYSMSGLVFGATFIPQIMALANDRSGASSTSISTWLVFAAYSLVSLSYACTHSKDIFFIFCSSIGAAGNLIVLVLAATRRLQFKSPAKPAQAIVSY